MEMAAKIVPSHRQFPFRGKPSVPATRIAYMEIRRTLSPRMRFTSANALSNINVMSDNNRNRE
jgi:hypothetical protein